MIKTTHIRKLVQSALDDIDNYLEDATSGIPEGDVAGVVNKLRHAAEELEAERLEHFHNVKQV